MACSTVNFTFTVYPAITCALISDIESSYSLINASLNSLKKIQESKGKAYRCPGVISCDVMSVVTVLVAWQRYNLRWPLLPINLPPDSKAAGINNGVTRGVRNPEPLEVTARFYSPPCPQRSKKFPGPGGRGSLRV